MKLLITAAAFVLSGSAAYAGQATTYIKTTISDEPITEKVGPQPYDFSNINQSPIRGKGAIKVVHNEPAPDESGAIHKARWLLQDNGWSCYKPTRKGPLQ